MESMKIENMLTLEETIAKELFEGATYPCDEGNQVSTGLVWEQ